MRVKGFKSSRRQMISPNGQTWTPQGCPRTNFITLLLVGRRVRLSNLGISHPDYGWGTYDFLTHDISGSKIFVISLANGAMKKLKIDLMSGFGQQFIFTYANLDGSNEITQSISKAAYSDKNFVYFDISSGQILDREPASNQWDLVVRRYGIEIRMVHPHYFTS